MVLGQCLMLRTVVFWCHLGCGVAVGLVVLMMSVTGVILTYERQLLARADSRAYYQQPDSNAERISLNKLIQIGHQVPDFKPTNLTVYSNPAAPVELRAGRQNKLFLNPYSGEIYPLRSEMLDNFFSLVTRWHRWFALSGENRAWGRMVTGVSNLGFLFLIVSGLYLWLPRTFKWTAFKMRLWFSTTPNSAARDFNWHHVLGIWAAIPLLIIVPSAVVFNFTWANNLVYTLAGEAPPQRGGRVTGENNQVESAPLISSVRNYDGYLQTASETIRDWQSISIALNNESTITIAVDTGNGGQPQKRQSLNLDATTNAVVSSSSFSDLSAGRQARSWLRFLHTGEALGWLGQTIAGLASLAAVVMVWTGLALAWRRLRRNLIKPARVSPAPSLTIEMESG